MRKRFIVGGSIALLATLAIVAAGYASSDRHAAKKVLPSASCASVTKSGSYKYIIASDLPMQGPNRPQTTQMVAAIKYLLRTKWHYKAGKYKVAFQACDDSTAESAKWNSAKCSENARNYANDRSVIGVIGTFNSGCAKLIVPVLNRAPGGPVAMVSPANTAVGLTISGLGSNPGEPNIYYPTGKRNYARVVTRDDVQGPAGALWAACGLTKAGICRAAPKKPKISKVYILTDKEVYGAGVAATFKAGAQKLGIKVVGGPDAWDPKASSYEPLATRIKQTGAQAVYLGGIVCNNGAQLIKGLRAVLGPKVAIIGPDGWTPFSAVAAAGDPANGMYITVPGAPPSALKGPGGKFVKAFQKSIGGKVLAPYAAYAAQAADYLMTAISKSNGTRGSVSSHLFNVTVKNGIIGTFHIDKNGDTNLAGITGYRMVKGDGKAQVTLYPSPKLTKR